MRRIVVFALVALQVSMGFASETKLRILARVGDTSISNREILIEWILKNPKSYVPGRRDYYSSDVEKQLLQEYVVQVLVEEENRLVGTQTLSANLVEKRLLDVRKNFGPRWPAFRNDFEISETEVKTRLSKSLLASQTLETRLRDSLQGSKGESDAAALKKAEDGLQTWLQQLRSRYKVQILRYEEPQEPVASP
ncbi:MAG: hypothetical protein ABIR96_00745 [Bdellovibrionota bacterium]